MGRLPEASGGLRPAEKTMCSLLGVSAAVAGFPWFRLPLGFIDTSPMHIYIVGLSALFAFRGAQALGRVWLALLVMLLVFSTLNLIPNAGDDVLVGFGQRLLVKMFLCGLGAVGMAGLAQLGPEAVERFFNAMTTVVLLVGLWLFYNSFIVMGEQFINVSPDFEQGSSVNRNLSAFTFALCTVAAFASMLNRPSTVSLIKTIVLGILTTLSASRGAVASGLIGIALCAFVLVKNKRAVVLTVFLGFMTWTFRDFVPTPITNRFVALFDAAGDEGLSGRDELFSIAFVQALPEAPMTGHGTGTATEVTSRFLSSGKRTDAHGDFNLLAIEAGLVGVALYLSMVVIVGRSGLAALRRAPPGPLHAAMALALSSVGVAVAHGFFETQIDFIQIWMMYGFSLGLAHVIARTSTVRRGLVPAPRPVPASG